MSTFPDLMVRLAAELVMYGLKAKYGDGLVSASGKEAALFAGVTVKSLIENFLNDQSIVSKLLEAFQEADRCFAARVDEDLLVPDLDRLAGKADDSLDEVALGVLRVLEDHHVPASEGPLGQEPVLQGAGGGGVHELVDQEVVSNEEVLLHGAGGDLEGLHREGADEQGQDDRDHDGLEVLAGHGLLESGANLRLVTHRSQF